MNRNDPDFPEFDDIDRLIEETRQQLGDVPEEQAEPAAPVPEQPDAQPQTPAAPAPYADFEPDFGNAFDDYGEYNAPQEEQTEPPEGDKTERFAREEAQLKKERGNRDLPSKRPRAKSAPRRILPLFVKIVLYVVIVGLIGVGAGYGAWEAAEDVLAFHRSPDELTVTINEGDSVGDIAQMLCDNGVIKYPSLFKFYCKFTKSSDKMDPGTYTIHYNYDYHALVNAMVETKAERETVRVMIPEGANSAQIFALMEKNGVCSQKALEVCAASTYFDYWFLEGLPYGAANRLEGFLFPDTYDFYLNDEPERVINRLLSNFDRKITDNAQKQLVSLNERVGNWMRNFGYDEAFIQAHELSFYDVVIVASMIEKETAGATESGNIASVIYNRLLDPDRYPLLQIDATVVYALGGIDGALTYEDTQVDSPYNTYKVQGLPVGPISNPGMSSITAAIFPTATTYHFYALDKSSGYHHFSVTYEEHNKFLETQNND